MNKGLFGFPRLSRAPLTKEAFLQTQPSIYKSFAKLINNYFKVS